MKPQPLLRDSLLARISARGGWVNTHGHFDRSYTVTDASLALAQRRMEQKWNLVDDMKKSSSEEDYFLRIEASVKTLMAQGVTASCTFIDVDELAELRALTAAVAVKKKYERKFTLVLINQVLKGVLDKTAKKWAEKSLEHIDIIGGLPSKDRPDIGKHLDTLFSWAKETGKMVHVHIDQENNPDEHDTELLADKTMEHGLVGKVVAVHAISLAAQSAKERERIYAKMSAAKLMVVCCPSAGLSMKQLAKTSELHNSMAPVAELIAHNIPVALGVDNISDIYQPLIDGDMYTELRMLAEANRYYDMDGLVDIATKYGKMAIGLA